MRLGAKIILIATALLCAMCGQAFSAKLEGEVLQIANDEILVSSPSPIQPHSMMMIMSGEGESVAGAAVVKKCTGGGPYRIEGTLMFVSDALNLTIGKKVQFNSPTGTTSSNLTLVDVQKMKLPAATAPTNKGMPDQDLKLYYYAAGQTVGYGALGVGYERTLRVSRKLGVELDGGVTAIGNVSASNADVINTDQLIKSMNGRVKLDFSPGLGIYSGYRWNQGRGEQNQWDSLVDQLRNKDFLAPSSYDSGTVQLQGMEYGLSLRPLKKLTLSAGYIPKYRTDFGSFGVASDPAYTGELRFGVRNGAIRLRGIRTDNYWLADLGITIR